MNTCVKDFVIGFFRAKGLNGMSDDESLECNYLDQGIIDSLGIVELITAAEKEFNIRFDQDELQSDEFGVIGGLINIISEKLSA